MKECKLFRIMIGCPSDVREEESIAEDIIVEWSTLNVDSHGIVLLPLHWKKNAYPIADNPPQKTLNRQLVDKSDLLVCIFASKIGTPTDTAESGSIEEIEEHIKANKPVMLYFRKQIDISKTTTDNLRKLLDFKTRVQKDTLYWDYSDENEFADVFRRQLQQFINDNWITSGNGSSKLETPAESEPIIQFNKKEMELFSRWANNPVDTTYSAVRVRNGLEVHFGYKNGYTYTRGEEEATFEDYMGKLLQIGYVVDGGDNGRGLRNYKITKKGYNFAKTLLKMDK